MDLQLDSYLKLLLTASLLKSITTDSFYVAGGGGSGGGGGGNVVSTFNNMEVTVYGQIMQTGLTVFLIMKKQKQL